MKGLIASVSALFSSACCLGPAVVGGLGAGAGTAGLLGAAAGFLKALIPFQNLFITAALFFLALNYYAVYGPRRKACLSGGAGSAKRYRKEKILLWTNTAVVILFILSPYLLAIG
ncbi:MAG: mercuric transporter MerT family protein [Nitrospiria bacterium]